jgi:Chemotaxis protein histidine kinase and related kinases
MNGGEMDGRIEMLRELGSDVDDAMERFLDDDGFYLECLEQVLYDDNFERLKIALENHQIQEAFDCAHTLKGLVANLGLTSLDEKLEEVVEPLREGKDAGLTEKYQEIMGEREKYVDAIAK